MAAAPSTAQRLLAVLVGIFAGLALGYMIMEVADQVSASWACGGGCG